MAFKGIVLGKQRRESAISFDYKRAPQLKGFESPQLPIISSCLRARYATNYRRNQMQEHQSKTKKVSAFKRDVQLSPTLTAVVGAGPMPRTEVTKKLWEYIKKNNLQSRTDKRMIKPDEKLSRIFGSTSEINMFEMTKKVSQHITERSPAGCGC